MEYIQQKRPKACIKKWPNVIEGNKIDLNKWRQTIFIDEEIPKIFTNIQSSFNQDINVVFTEIEQTDSKIHFKG